LTNNGKLIDKNFGADYSFEKLFPTITICGQIKGFANFGFNKDTPFLFTPLENHIEKDDQVQLQNLESLQKVTNICWVIVFSYFAKTPKDLAQLSLVCKKFNFIINQRQKKKKKIFFSF
jgi:hypothetical protein